MTGYTRSLALLAAACLYSRVNASPLKQVQARAPAQKIPHIARDACAQTTYTIITPSPGAEPTPVTAQFQSVCSYIPEYVEYNAQYPGSYNTIYSVTSYQWVSTQIPCYSGMCVVTDAYQALTFAASPTYAISTATCTAAGYYTFGDSTTYISAPTAVTYVASSMDYYSCPYSSYSDFHSSGGIGEFSVEVQSCSSGVCNIYPIYMVYSTQVVTNYVTYPINVNQYCPENTLIAVDGGINIGITITVDNAPTTVSTVVSGTSTVTSTRTTTSTKSVTK